MTEEESIDYLRYFVQIDRKRLKYKSAILMEQKIHNMTIQTLTIDIPEQLLGSLTRLDSPLSNVVLQALEQYVITLNSQSAVAQNRTWELCGSFELAETLGKSIDEPIDLVTNDAENVNNLLYGSMTIDG